jgi:hypothetical protein
MMQVELCRVLLQAPMLAQDTSKARAWARSSLQLPGTIVQAPRPRAHAALMGSNSHLPGVPGMTKQPQPRQQPSSLTPADICMQTTYISMHA